GGAEERERHRDADRQQDGDREGEEKESHSPATSAWSSSTSATIGPCSAMSAAEISARMAVLTTPISTGRYTHDMGTRRTGDLTMLWVSTRAQASSAMPTAVAATMRSEMTWMT